jgi:hypothetical protein
MTQASTNIGLAVLLSGVAFGQAGITAAGTSAPATADVHVSPKARVPSMAAGGLRGTRYLVHQATMALSELSPSRPGTALNACAELRRPQSMRRWSIRQYRVHRQA